MPTRLVHYRGFIVRITFHGGARGVIPTATLTREGASSTVQLKHPGPGFDTEAEALAAGIEYAKAAIDEGAGDASK